MKIETPKSRSHDNDEYSGVYERQTSDGSYEVVKVYHVGDDVSPKQEYQAVYPNGAKIAMTKEKMRGMIDARILLYSLEHN